MTQQRSELHIETPIDDLEEIPYDRSQMGPGALMLEIKFDREEIDRLKARRPRGPLIRFIKQAALEAADRSAQPTSSDTHAAD